MRKMMKAVALICVLTACSRSGNDAEGQAKKANRLAQKLEKSTVVALIKEHDKPADAESIRKIKITGIVEIHDYVHDPPQPNDSGQRPDSAVLSEAANLNLEFYRKLVAAGFLTEEACTDAGPEYRNEYTTYYCYRPKRGEVMRVKTQGFHATDVDLWFPMSKVSSINVTKLVQASGAADVEVQSQWSYTEVWNAIRGICVEMQPKLQPV